MPASVDGEIVLSTCVHPRRVHAQSPEHRAQMARNPLLVEDRYALPGSEVCPAALKRSAVKNGAYHFRLAIRANLSAARRDSCVG